MSLSKVVELSQDLIKIPSVSRDGNVEKGQEALASSHIAMSYLQMKINSPPL